MLACQTPVFQYVAGQLTLEAAVGELRGWVAAASAAAAPGDANGGVMFRECLGWPVRSVDLHFVYSTSCCLEKHMYTRNVRIT